MTSARCKHSKCLKAFQIVWGPGSLANRRLYCSTQCRREAARLRQRLASKRDREKINAVRQRRNRAVTGRQCQWKHCQVDDSHHIGNWNSSSLICPSCAKQAQREGSCEHCDGPMYHHGLRKSLHCPNCYPVSVEPGEVSVTLVCLATGRERQLVRSPNWKLPDGTSLSKVQFEGFAVIDLAPKIWARYRV